MFTLQRYGASATIGRFCNIAKKFARLDANLYLCRMDHSLITELVGYAAATAMVCGYLPQAIYTIRTHDTESITLPTFLLMGVGALFFVVQGVLSANIPLVITNVITSTCCVVITAIKLRNDRRK